jgi:DNA (cytosine-5)-methyltransferase 1
LPSIPEGENYLWHTPRNDSLRSEPLFGWRTRYWSFLLKLAKNQPSWTIQAEPGPATGPFHWRSRLLSIEELCRLQTFPTGYEIVGTRRSAHRQIGNAVPSAIAELLGLEIRRQFFHDKVRHSLRLIPSARRDCPPPIPPRRVPTKYLHLRFHHREHPGPGLGPGARKREHEVRSTR